MVSTIVDTKEWNSTFSKLSLLSNYVYAVHYFHQRADVICAKIISFFFKQKKTSTKNETFQIHVSCVQCVLCSAFKSFYFYSTFQIRQLLLCLNMQRLFFHPAELINHERSFKKQKIWISRSSQQLVSHYQSSRTHFWRTCFWFLFNLQFTE